MAIWLDVTTILQWQYRPVGIIRVETELAREFLLGPTWRFRFCRFDSDERRFLVVAPEELRQLPAFASLPVSRANRLRRNVARSRTAFHRWMSRVLAGVLRRLPQPLRAYALRTLAANDSTCGRDAPLVARWSQRDTYLSVGLDWDDKDLSLLLQAKCQFRFQVVLCCYDLIPVLFPQFTMASTRERFPAYLRAMASCADAIVCISHSTRSDLQSYLYNHGLPQPRLEIFRLGTDLPGILDSHPPASPAVESVLQRGSFVLMVSTIEARKGHDVLYRAYRSILSSNEPESVPVLVLVGMEGWGVEALVESIRHDPLVADSIVLLSGLADTDVTLLYRRCLFTVFPSQYEGWGLPVAESLAHGKFCLASNRASLPEVGGTFCEYLDALDERQWADRILFFCRNRDALIAKEKAIQSAYRPYSWRHTSHEVVALVETL
jgi:glycosyltransferase involved in cell wall biosynthesis